MQNEFVALASKVLKGAATQLKSTTYLVMDPSAEQNVLLLMHKLALSGSDIAQLLKAAHFDPPGPAEAQITEAAINQLLKVLPKPPEPKAKTEAVPTIAGLKPKAPEPNKLEMLASAQLDTLTKAEAFLAELVQGTGYKVIRPLLEAVRFMLSFDEDTVATRQQIAQIQTAGQQMRTSRTFRKILQLTLALGNTLNAGTGTAGTIGISLTSLAKLSGTKSTLNPQITFVHRLVELAGGQAAIDTLLTELDSLPSVAIFDPNTQEILLSYVTKDLAAGATSLMDAITAQDDTPSPGLVQFSEKVTQTTSQLTLQMEELNAEQEKVQAYFTFPGTLMDTVLLIWPFVLQLQQASSEWPGIIKAASAAKVSKESRTTNTTKRSAAEQENLEDILGSSEIVRQQATQAKIKRGRRETRPK